MRAPHEPRAGHSEHPEDPAAGAVACAGDSELEAEDAASVPAQEPHRDVIVGLATERLQEQIRHHQTHGQQQPTHQAQHLRQAQKDDDDL